MEKFTVCFFGHRQIEDKIVLNKSLREEILKLAKSKEYVEFLVGRNGEFDETSALSVFNVKKYDNCENISLNLVLPYMTAEYRNNKELFHKLYDNIEISEKASNSHFKY